MAEVARAADVSEGTVFNYFPTKEDLVYGGMETFEAQLVEAVRQRPAGEAVLAAFRRFLLDRSAGLAAEETAEAIDRAARLDGASPVLQRREREVVAQATGALAVLLAEETGAGDQARTGPRRPTSRPAKGCGLRKAVTSSRGRVNTMACTAVDAEIRDLGARWAAAKLIGDAETLGPLLTDDFIGVGLPMAASPS